MRLKKISEQYNILERMRLRIRHGVMEPSKQYEGVRRYPPDPKPYNAGKIPVIRLPTDRLERARRAAIRRDLGSTSPSSNMDDVVPLEAPARDPVTWFARRQHEAMVSLGLDEAAAALHVEAKLAEQLVEMTAQVETLGGEFRTWHQDWSRKTGDPVSAKSLAVGAEALAPPRLEGDAEGQRQYQGWLAKVENADDDFRHWNAERQAELDGFLVTYVLKWTWMQERALDEAIALTKFDSAPTAQGLKLTKAIEALRVDVFWPHIAPAGAHEVPAVFEPVEPDPADPDVDPFDEVFDALQAQCESRLYKDWTDEEKAVMDAWLQEHCIDNQRVLAVEPKAGGLALFKKNKVVSLEGVRLEIFPETSDHYARDAQKVPEDEQASESAASNQRVTFPLTSPLDRRMSTGNGVFSVRRRLGVLDQGQGGGHPLVDGAPTTTTTTTAPYDPYEAASLASINNPDAAADEAALAEFYGPDYVNNSLQIKHFRDKNDIIRALAQDGVFLQKYDRKKILDELKAINEEPNSELQGTLSLTIEELEDPESYTNQRLRVQRRALAEEALVERIHAKLSPRKDILAPIEGDEY